MQIYQPNGSGAQRFAFNGVQLAAPPQAGSTYALASRLDTDKVVDVQWASPADGADVWLWGWNGSAAQRFTVKDAGGGAIELWTGTGANKVVDVAYSGMTSGTNVWQWTANGSSAQRWIVRPTGDLDGSYYIVSRANGLYLDVASSGTSDGTNIWVYQGNASAAQKFLPRKIS
nr:RICIN domain-containing protein [Raineyella fluvialis]